MRNYVLLFTIAALLVACSTPITLLKNPKTGQVARCGGDMTGSLGGGLIGYNIQKDNDEDCVKKYQDLGFNVQDTHSRTTK